MFSSIRVKLTLWYIGILATLITVFALIGYSLFVSALRENTDETLSQMARTLTSSIQGEEHDEESERSSDEHVQERLNEFRFRDYQFVVLTPANKMVATTSQYDQSLVQGSVGNDEQYGAFSIEGSTLRVYLSSFRVDNHNYKLYTIHSLADESALASRIRQAFLLTGPLLLVFAGLGGFLLARTSLRPIAEIGERAKKISSANLSERLPVINPKDEIGSMAIVFNDLLDRLDRDFDRQKRFMADASHELRTPVAIIRGESEVALSKDSRTADDYQQSLAIVQDESKRLTKIVDDLFALARADSGEIRPDMRPVYVDEIVSDCVRAIRTLADERDIKIDLSAKEMPLKGDETLLRRLFLNLLDNAVKYNIRGGSIRIRVERNEVVISNTGEAIPEAEEAAIFDRFYRVERARTQRRETIMGGAGLGLSIAKQIAELHGASLQYSRNDNDETVFTVVFPY